MMRHIVKCHKVDKTTYGSIPGRDAIEAMGVLQQIFENHRLFNCAMVAIFNYAAGCYDCIRAQLAEICLCCLGCPASISKTQTAAQMGMMHCIRTSLGISPGTIKWADKELVQEVIDDIIHFYGNIGGIGQGGGGSPVKWFVILLALIDLFTTFSPCSSIVDHLDEHAIDMHVFSYMDDNTILCTFKQTMTDTELFTTLSTELEHWWKLLKLTGGDLTIEKCTCSVMK